MLCVIISEHKDKLKFLKSQHCSLLFLVLSLFNTQYFVSLLLFFASPSSMQDLSSSTNDQTPAPYSREHRVINTGIPGKSLSLFHDYTVKHLMYHRQ